MIAIAAMPMTLRNTVVPPHRRALFTLRGPAFFGIIAAAAFFLLFSLPAQAGSGSGGTNASAAAASAIEYEAYDPAPTGALRVARPTFVWRIIPVGDSRVTAVALTINGKPVSAAYDTARSAVVYEPDFAFAPGAYKVRCEVTLDEVWTVERDWQFSIARDAVNALPAPDARQQKALADVNAVRRMVGLPVLRLDNRLCAAASGHSNYLRKNNRIQHTQQKGGKGFVGQDVGARVGTFGYAGGCFETISEGADSLSQAVTDLFDAPYHRAAFLQPGGGDFGAGVDGDLVTLIFGASDTESVVTYPANGQKNVPLSWDGNETPNPLRLHIGGAPSGRVGYAITLFHHSPAPSRLKIRQASLFTAADNKPVPAFINTPDNDDFLPNGVLLVPKKPLRPATAYKVIVTGQTETGMDISRTWTFTTR